MQCTYYFITEPKLGNTEEENEDNISVPPVEKLKTSSVLQFAIADGATESSYSREWAALLTQAHDEVSFNKKTVKANIEAAAQQWQTLIATKDLPWYGLEKVQSGAFATFLGITVCLEDKYWIAFAVGDCNLMQIREREVVALFPIKDVNAFGNTPQLICSKTQKNKLEDLFTMHGRSLQSGDILLLATDALAAWLMKNKAQAPYDSLTSLLTSDNREGFRDWLQEKRRNKEIKNDDTSLLLIKFD